MSTDQSVRLRALKILLSLLALAVLASPAASSASIGPAATGDTGPVTWTNVIPFSPSPTYSGVTFTGPWASYTGGSSQGADTWYPSWGSDDNLYSSYMDGSCDGQYANGQGLPATLGLATISGSDPMNLSISCHVIGRNHTNFQGRYASASLMYNGAWYYGSYVLNDPSPSGAAPCGALCTLGPFLGFDVSTQGGIAGSWQQTTHTTSNPLFGESPANGYRVKLGALHFVDFGKNMQYSPDGYAYLVGGGGGGPTSENNWIANDSIYLVRFKPNPSTVDSRSTYQYYAGQVNGQPQWSSDFNAIQPIMTWAGHLGNTSITYDPGIGRYLTVISRPSDGINVKGQYDTMILESTSLTGPWKIIHYLPGFGTQGYFANIPSKFISSDGLTMWLLYSANWNGNPVNLTGSGYAAVFRQMRLNLR